MVLVVCRIGPDELEISDGWYSLPCAPFSAGDPLHALVNQGRILQGTKLLVQVSISNLFIWVVSSNWNGIKNNYIEHTKLPDAMPGG